MQVYSMTRAPDLYAGDKQSNRPVVWGFWRHWALRIYQGKDMTTLSLFTPDGAQFGFTTMITEYTGSIVALRQEAAHCIVNMRSLWSLPMPKRINRKTHSYLDSYGSELLLLSGALLVRVDGSGEYALVSKAPVANSDLRSLLIFG